MKQLVATWPLSLALGITWLAASAAPSWALASAPALASSSVQAYVVRLHPGEDLKRALQDVARREGLHAAFVATAVGSLRHARIRFADQPEGTDLDGKFEIDSLVGTLETDGAHLHLSISDGKGRTYGGHLMDGCLIYTTAEVVLGELPGLTFTREVDPQTTYYELMVRARKNAQQ